jgi:hypothetical protein
MNVQILITMEGVSCFMLQRLERMDLKALHVTASDIPINRRERILLSEMMRDVRRNNIDLLGLTYNVVEGSVPPWRVINFKQTR